MRMGATMMRFGSNLDLTTPALSGLIMVVLLVFGAIVIQIVGPAEKDVRVIPASERSEVRTRTTPEDGGRITPAIGGVTGLRGSLQ